MLAGYACVAVLVVALFGRSIGHGLIFDDYPIGLRIQSWFAGDPNQSWWDLFEFGHFEEAMRFSGAVPWWTAEDLFVRFFRPIAAASHVLDYWLWPTSPALMHVHSLVWAVGLGASTLWLYREVLRPRVALLAAITYSVSAIHAWPVMWISNRNALIAGVFGVLAFGLYRRGRLQGSRAGWLAPGALGVCLLGAEAGISTLALVAGFEFTQGRTVPRRRALFVASLLAVVVTWRVAYDAAGFGARGSGAYLDPLGAPAAFLAQAPSRIAWLLMELATPFDLVRWPGFPSPLRWALGALFCAGFALSIVHGWRRQPTRMFLVAAALALPPLLTSMPQARLLTFVWIGVAPSIALAVLHYAEAAGVRRLLAVLVGVRPLVVSPAIVLGGSEWLASLWKPVADTPGLEIASDKLVRERSLIVVHAPTFERAMAMGFARAQAGKPLPTFSWLLSTGEKAPTIRRRGCCTLVVEQPNGFVGDPLASYYRGPQVPFSVGDTVKTLAFEANVEAVNRGGAATRVAFEFPHSLGAKRLLFVTWTDGDFGRVRPRTLPRTDPQ